MNNENVEFLIYSDNRFNQIRKLASEYKTRTDHILPKEYWEKLSYLKKNAVNSSDQLTAKVAWCFETIGEIQDKFVEIYIHFISGEFYKGWCHLERCEILIGFLDEHFHEKNNEFGIEHIRIHTKNFQSLFPYKIFSSPGFILKHRCSVCKKLITPRNHCGHEIGEIYDGEMCQKLAETIQILEFSIVDNPVQKYSVLFPEGQDNYNYGAIKYIVKKISSPWDIWDYEKSKKLIPKYEKVGRNELCPCDSGMKYKKCCLRKKREIDHFEFTY